MLNVQTNFKNHSEVDPNNSRAIINYFYHALTFYTITVGYVIPYHTNIPYAKVGLPLLTLILILQTIIYRARIRTLDILTLCAILTVELLSLSQSILFRYVAPICFILLGFQENKSIAINRKFLLFIHWYSIPFILQQLAVHRSGNDILTTGNEGGRIVLSSGDPNVSGLFMLVFFFFCFKNKIRFGIVLSIVCAFLFISRNYIFSLTIFFLIYLFEDLFAKIASKINFSFLLVFTNLLLLVLGNYWISNVEIAVGYDTGFGRIFTVNDASNLERFEANHYFVESFLKNLELALFGFKENYVEAFQNSGNVILHNATLQIAATLGLILGLLYLSVILRMIHRYYYKENFKYIYSYFFFSLFLHSAFEGALLLLFVTSLSLPEHRSVKRRSILRQNT